MRTLITTALIVALTASVSSADEGLLKGCEPKAPSGKVSFREGRLAPTSAIGRFHSLEAMPSSLTASFTGDNDAYALGYKVGVDRNSNTVVSIEFSIQGWEATIWFRVARPRE